MQKLKTLLPLFLALSLLAATEAAAAPSTYQKFEAKIVGKSKAGTAKKPASVGTYLRPFHTIVQDPSCLEKPNLADCKNNTFGPASVAGGALSEAPFATLTATIFLPKQLKLATTGFPSCSIDKVLDGQHAVLCPKGSMIGSGVAEGYVRKTSAAQGTYTIVVKPEVKVYVLTDKNTIALRVYSSLSKAAIIPGVISKTSGVEAKTYGSRIDFSLPKGLIDVSGLISQLSTFDSTIKAAKNKSGKPLQALTGCPASKKLDFGYQAKYNVGLDHSQAPFYTAGGSQYSVNHVGPIVTSKVPCTK